MLHRSNRAAACLALFAFLGGCALGCSKAADTNDVMITDSALIEVLGNATVAWRVGADGKTAAQITDKDGKPVTKDARGTIAWKTDSGEAASAKLSYDADAKALVAAGPPPRADITELKYEIAVKDGAITGALHVPVGGTAAIVSGAKASEKIATDATGPNGGVVQVVGDDRIEIVADDESDEVRVYVLDAGGKAIVAGERKITLGIDADGTEIIVLTPSPDGLYLTGKWKAKVDPSRITLVVRKGGEARVAIVGWKPGAKLVVSGGPRLKVKKHGLGWGAGGKPVELRGREGAGITPSGVIKVDLKGKDDEDRNKGHFPGHGKRK